MRHAPTLAVLLVLLPACAASPPPQPRTSGAHDEAGLPWPKREVLALALEAHRCAEAEGHFSRPLLTIIDYSLPSTERRLWVIDMQQGQVLHHELVAHGEGSGGTMAVAFSNEHGSHQSSLGLFRTDEAYFGRFGYSLRLSGLEPGINDNARDRAIVIHGAADVSEAHAALWGTIGRSWGCPALPVEVASQIIARIADGSAIFSYHPDAQWLTASRYLRCREQLAKVVGAEVTNAMTGNGHPEMRNR